MEETIIIDVKLNDEDAGNRLKELSALYAANVKQIDANKAKLKELNKEFKEGKISQERYGQQTILLKTSTAELTNQNRALEAEGRAVITVTEKQTNAFINANGSIVSMRREVTELQRQYALLSKTERESAGGREMLKKIQNLELETRDAEVAMRNFKTNIGNYPQAVTTAVPGFDKLSGMLNAIGADIQTLATGGVKGFSAIAKGAKAFGMALLTPPVSVVVAILAAIILVVQGVVKAFKKNDDATTKLQVAFSKFQPIISAIKKAFDILAQAIAIVVGFIAELITAFVKFNPIVMLFNKIFPSVSKNMNEATKEAEKLIVAIDNLEDVERDYLVNKEKRDAEIARLRAEALDKEKFTAEERKKMFNDAKNLEEQNLKDAKDIAEEKLKILEMEAKQNSDTSDEMKNKKAQALAEMYKAEKDYQQGRRKLEREYLTTVKEINDEEKKVAEDRKKRHKEYLQQLKERNERTKKYAEELEDVINQTIEEGEARELQELEITTRRRIEELRNRLKTEEKLTKKDIANIKMLIKHAEEDYVNIKKEITGRYNKERIEREIKAETEAIELRIASYGKGEDKYYSLREKALERAKILELKNTDLTEKERANIIEKYRQQIEQLDIERQKEAYNKEIEQLRLKYENLMLITGENEEKLLEIEKEYLQEELTYHLEMDEKTKAALFSSEEEYTNAVLQLKERIRKANEAISKQSFDSVQEQIALTGELVNSLQKMLNEMGEDFVAFAVFNKILALANATVKLGEAIAAATSTAASGGDPYTVALRIASAGGAVLASFSSVFATIRKAIIPETPKFAKGGIVAGSSYSGDNLQIRVNSGEMILNAEQQAKLFKIANQGVMLENNLEKFALILTNSLEKLPAPLLDYTEFTNFQKRLTKIKEYENI